MSRPDGIHSLTLGAALYVCQRMRPLDRACVNAMLGEISADTFAIDRFQSPGAAWFMEQDGEPVAIFGLQHQHEKSVVAWLCCTGSMRSFKKLIRFSRTVADNAAAHGVRRIEVHVLQGWARAEEFAKHLGCTFEGTRRHSGVGGESFHVYSRVSP